MTEAYSSSRFCRANLFPLAGFALVVWVAVASGLAAESPADLVLTNVASVRSLSPEDAARRLPVRVSGVVTFVFDRGACFIQDETAGIYVGTGAELADPKPGDLLAIEGITGPGEYAPIIRPSSSRVLGRTNFPAPKRVAYEDLITGREDSQWVEVAGLVRACNGEPSQSGVLEIATGGGRLSAFVPAGTNTSLARLVDCRVRVRGVCGTWFNRLRQLFGVRLMVPSAEEILVEESAPPDAFSQPAVPIGHLLQFAPMGPSGRRVKVAGTVILQQPGRALFVQEDGRGLCAQTPQAGVLHPGDRVEVLGFPAVGDYTPMMQDAAWRKTGTGAEPTPARIWPDEALAGMQDCLLVQIEGHLLNLAQSGADMVLVMEADRRLFSANLDVRAVPHSLGHLRPGMQLRLTGVCRIEVGSDWRAGQDWRAKSFRILLRSPADVHVLRAPPWWTLQRLFWAVGIVGAAGLGALGWAGSLRRRVTKQTRVIRQQLDTEATLKERYKDLFENANDMVYTADLEGRLTSLNAAGERLLERPRSALMGVALADLVVEEQREPARQWAANARNSTAPATVEWDFQTGGGQVVRLEISTRLIEHAGKGQEVEGIARDVTERRRLEREILEISTREQRRIGHDLHDGVCQQLAGIALLADTLAEKLEERQRPEAADAHKLTALVNDANKQTRGVARGLFPVRLEENGLLSALEELAASAAGFLQTQCEFHCDAHLRIRDQALAHHLYYIAQEAILNAARHGRARQIEIRLTAEGRQWVLAIRDNGAGLPPDFGRGPGMGIRIMAYRARMIGAGLDVRWRAEGGTEVICRCPLPAPA